MSAARRKMFTPVAIGSFSGVGKGEIMLRSTSGQVQFMYPDARGVTLPAYTGLPDDPNASLAFLRPSSRPSSADFRRACLTEDCRSQRVVASDCLATGKRAGLCKNTP